MEKIKVSVPSRLYELLYKDALDFKILKANGDGNLNALVNRIIVNFHEEFSADEETLRENVKNALFAVPERYARDAYEGVMKAIAKREREHATKDKSVALSFKPTRESESATVYIENVLLSGESLSSFYRRMFTAYAGRPKNERERIIHKGIAEQLLSAIERRAEVCLSLDNGHVYNGASVYALEAARDELFNYVLFYSDKKNRTIRLSKVRTVSLLATPAAIPSENTAMFDRQIRCGAQYPIYSTDNNPIKVQLSPKGRELFEKIYLYRPVPVSIDGDVYTFDCSANQVLYYFERFGSEALILSPKKLGIFMRNYYYFALKKYRSIYGKD